MSGSPTFTATTDPSAETFPDDARGDRVLEVGAVAERQQGERPGAEVLGVDLDLDAGVLLRLGAPGRQRHEGREVAGARREDEDAPVVRHARRGEARQVALLAGRARRGERQGPRGEVLDVDVLVHVGVGGVQVRGVRREDDVAPVARDDGAATAVEARGRRPVRGRRDERRRPGGEVARVELLVGTLERRDRPVVGEREDVPVRLDELRLAAVRAERRGCPRDEPAEGQAGGGQDGE
ncbi:hypothetical protein Q9R32_13690 [Actinotalea sp. AC32]|nr:hypothetical protein [Actinotalea sp. AC32]